MKHVALILVWIILLALLALSGCSNGKVDDKKVLEQKLDNNMFIKISEEAMGMVIVDKETNVMYWISKYSSGAGIMTLLVNPDGTPKIWKEV